MSTRRTRRTTRIERHHSPIKPPRPTAEASNVATLPTERKTFRAPSLPPRVPGTIKGHIHVRVDQVLWNHNHLRRHGGAAAAGAAAGGHVAPSPGLERLPEATPCVRLRWWGERGPGTLFRPHLCLSEQEMRRRASGRAVSAGDGDESDCHTVSFPIVSSAHNFLEFLKQVAVLQLDVFDSTGRTVFGSAAIELAPLVHAAHSIDDVFPILNGEQVIEGKLHASLTLDYPGLVSAPPELMSNGAAVINERRHHQQHHGEHRQAPGTPTSTALVERAMRLRDEMRKATAADPYSSGLPSATRPARHGSRHPPPPEEGDLHDALQQVDDDDTQQLFEELFFQDGSRRPATMRSPPRYSGRAPSPRRAGGPPLACIYVRVRGAHIEPPHHDDSGFSSDSDSDDDKRKPRWRSPRARMPKSSSPRKRRSSTKRRTPKRRSRSVPAQRRNVFVSYRLFKDLDEHETRVARSTAEPRFGHHAFLPRVMSRQLLHSLSDSLGVFTVWHQPDGHRPHGARKQGLSRARGGLGKGKKSDPVMLGLAKLPLESVAKTLERGYTGEVRGDNIGQVISFNGELDIVHPLTGDTHGTLNVMVAAGTEQQMNELHHLERASIRAQSITRGFMARKKHGRGRRRTTKSAASMGGLDGAVGTQQPRWRAFGASRTRRPGSSYLDDQFPLPGRRRVGRGRQHRHHDEQEWAATTIQRHFRGHRQRRQFQRLRRRPRAQQRFSNEEDWAATTIQRHFRGHQQRKRYKRMRGGVRGGYSDAAALAFGEQLQQGAVPITVEVDELNLPTPDLRVGADDADDVLARLDVDPAYDAFYVQYKFYTSAAVTKSEPRRTDLSRIGLAGSDSTLRRTRRHTSSKAAASGQRVRMHHSATYVAGASADLVCYLSDEVLEVEVWATQVEPRIENGEAMPPVGDRLLGSAAIQLSALLDRGTGRPRQGAVVGGRYTLENTALAEEDAQRSGSWLARQRRRRRAVQTGFVHAKAYVGAPASSYTRGQSATLQMLPESSAVRSHHVATARIPRVQLPSQPPSRSTAPSLARPLPRAGQSALRVTIFRGVRLPFIPHGATSIDQLDDVAGANVVPPNTYCSVQLKAPSGAGLAASRGSRRWYTPVVPGTTSPSWGLSLDEDADGASSGYSYIESDRRRRNAGLDLDDQDASSEGYSFDVPLPFGADEWAQLSGWRLVLQVFHQPLVSGSVSTLSAASASHNDLLLGTVTVSLDPLLSGLDEVNGWYHVIDFKRKPRGQLLLSARPLGDLQAQIQTHELHTHAVRQRQQERVEVVADEDPLARARALSQAALAAAGVMEDALPQYTEPQYEEPVQLVEELDLSDIPHATLADLHAKLGELEDATARMRSLGGGDDEPQYTDSAPSWLGKPLSGSTFGAAPPAPTPSFGFAPSARVRRRRNPLSRSAPEALLSPSMRAYRERVRDEDHDPLAFWTRHSRPSPRRHKKHKKHKTPSRKRRRSRALKKRRRLRSPKPPAWTKRRFVVDDDSSPLSSSSSSSSSTSSSSSDEWSDGEQPTARPGFAGLHQFDRPYRFASNMTPTRRSPRSTRHTPSRVRAKRVFTPAPKASPMRVRVVEDEDGQVDVAVAPAPATEERLSSSPRGSPRQRLRPTGKSKPQRSPRSPVHLSVNDENDNTATGRSPRRGKRSPAASPGRRGLPPRAPAGTFASPAVRGSVGEYDEDVDEAYLPSRRRYGDADEEQLARIARIMKGVE